MSIQEQPKPLTSREAQKGSMLPDLDKRMGQFESIVFGAPEAGLGRAAWERLQSNKGNEAQRARIMLMLRQNAERIVAAMKNRLDAGKGVAEETGKKLDALDEVFRSMGVMRKSMKMIRSPYVDSNVLDTDEGILLERFSDYLSKVNVEELVDMTVDNQKFVSMLDDGQGARDKTEIDPHTPEGVHQLRDLRELIIGGPVKGKERSGDRRTAEVALWTRIVGAMDFEQKEKLVEEFLDKDDEKGTQTKDFVNGAIFAGVLTKAEVVHMVSAAAKETTTVDGKILASKNTKESFFRTKLGDAFADSLDGAVAAHKEMQDGLQEMAAQLQNPRIENAAAHYLSFENIIAGRVMDWGVLTFALNTLVGGMEAWGKKQGKLSEKTLAFIKGSLGGATSGYALLGVAATALSTNKIHPWIDKFVNKPSQEEKEIIAHDSSITWLREEIANHQRPGNIDIGEYMEKHYEDYVRIAVGNKKNPERGAFDLYPGDIKITDAEAGALGYPNAKEATKTLHHFFDICAKSTESGGQQIATKEDLQKFLYTKIYPDYHARSKNPSATVAPSPPSAPEVPSLPTKKST